MKKDEKPRELKRLLSTLDNVLNELLSLQPIQIYWVSRKKAAEFYDVTPRTIHNWKNHGEIKFKEICGKTYYSVLPLLKEIDNSNN